MTALSAQKLTIVIHDDGSITERSRDRLLQSLPGARWVSRSHADEFLSDALSKWPNVARARTSLPHVMKLIDIGLIEQPDDTIRYVDTDIMFLRPFQGLFENHNVATSGAFLTDSKNSFGARIKDFKPLGPLRLARRLNSGLFWIRTSAVDYDRIEFLFRTWGLRRILEYGGWFEQTVWAAIAWSSRCKMFDDTQLATAHRDRDTYEGSVGTHFVTPTRHQLDELLRLQASRPDQIEIANTGPEVETIRLLPPKPYGITSALREGIEFRMRRATPLG